MIFRAPTGHEALVHPTGEFFGYDVSKNIQKIAKLWKEPWAQARATARASAGPAPDPRRRRGISELAAAHDDSFFIARSERRHPIDQVDRMWTPLRADQIHLIATSIHGAPFEPPRRSPPG